MGLLTLDECPYDGSRLHVFTHPDMVSMATMSPCRVAWMVAVARGLMYMHAAGSLHTAA